MNAIIQTSRMSFLDALHKQGAFYDVVATDNCFPVQTESGLRFYSTGKKTIVNGETGQPIGVMSKDYKIIQNREVFAELDKQIAKSGLNLDGAHTKVRVESGGARVGVQYIFPAHSVETAKGDSTNLQIVAMNSFNGSTAFHLYLGGFRGYCMNLQVFGTKAVSFRSVHNSQLNMSRAAESIGLGIQVFETESEIWKRMANTIVDQQTVYYAMARMAGVDVAKFADARAMVDAITLSGKNQKAYERNIAVFRYYERTMGHTEFALYNAMTHIATHGAGEKKRELSGSTLGDRMGLVRIAAKAHLSSYQQAA